MGKTVLFVFFPVEEEANEEVEEEAQKDETEIQVSRGLDKMELSDGMSLIAGGFVLHEAARMKGVNSKDCLLSCGFTVMFEVLVCVSHKKNVQAMLPKPHKLVPVEIKLWDPFWRCFSSFYISVNGIAKTEQKQIQLLNSFSFHNEAIERQNEALLEFSFEHDRGDCA
ncbi:hypothetical protein OIU85_002824 [Salix viminalis]|uniref:Uncharacterized protein n=1 Tax=Salix viminalis TaxID=40686 RepID=A0A9Q0ZZM1_SALVM|nr:hypothetical protein OIU85_002824 [Salix viminalis]